MIQLKDIILLSGLCILASCAKVEKKDTTYSDIPPIVPDIESFEINEVLKPIDMVIGDNYVCILNEEKASGEQIFIYDADNLAFKYKFATRGSGPQEILATDMVKNMVGDTLYLIDQVKYKILTYALKDDQAEFIKETNLLIPSMGAFQEVYIKNDSILIFSNLDGDLMTYNLNTEIIVDKLNMSSFINGVDAAERDRTDFHYGIVDNDVYVTLRRYDKLFKCGLDSTYSFQYSGITPVENNIPENLSLMDQHLYHTFIYAGKEHVLTQYYGATLYDMQPFPRNMNGQNLKHEFFLMDRELKPIARFKPDTDVLRIFLDDRHRRIYFLEAFEDFDNLKYVSF